MENKIGSIFTFNMKAQYGILFTVMLSIIVLYAIFGNMLFRLNSTYFATSGDGLRTYFNIIHYLKHDTNYLITRAMNYPYGDNIMFVDMFPMISVLMKLINSYIVDISDYTIGIINCVMLLSIVVGAVFIFLVFFELSFKNIFAVLASVIIAFMSPQLGRLGGHFALSLVFIIPAIIWLLMIFYRTKTYKISILISAFVIIVSFTHLYFTAFVTAYILLFFAVLFIFSGKQLPYRLLFHLAIQLLIPIIIVLIVSNIPEISDRTTHPWGFLVYRAYPEGVFLPFTKPYGYFLYKIMNFNHVQWEGWSFIGSISLIVTIVLLVKLFKLTFQRKFSPILNVTTSNSFNILFWISVLMLLFSFGIPFIMGLEWMVEYLGQIKQVRAIARFSWMFFYAINILAVYLIYNFTLKGKSKIAIVLVITCSLFIMSYDSYHNASGVKSWFKNTIVDEQIEIENLKFDFQTDKYQAVLPIPYFHIGSDNIAISENCKILEYTTLFCLKTGLPTFGSHYTRTSISQALSNMQITNEPYRTLQSIAECNSTSPFLVLVLNDCDMIRQSEKDLLKLCTKQIAQTSTFSVYELPFDHLLHIADSLSKNIQNGIENPALFQNGSLLTTDSTANFVYENFYGNLSNNAYMGVDAYEGVMKEANIIYNDTIQNYDISREYVASFWFGGIQTDRYARTIVHFICTDSKGNEYRNDYNSVGNLFQLLDNNWGLVEYKFRLNSAQDKFKIVLFMEELGNAKMYIDELMIRPTDNDLYIQLPEFVGKNNRYYPMGD